MIARARNTDPETSHIAATVIEKTGRAETQREICLEAVRSNPDLTAAEIAVICGLDRYTLSRRLPELRENGLVWNGKPRYCRVRNTLMQTWYAEPLDLFGTPLG